MKLKNAKKIVSVIFLISSIPAWSVECDPGLDKDKEILKLQKTSEEIKLLELKEQAAKTKDKVVKYFTEPTTVTCSTVSYKFPDYKISPGESVYFHIPEDLRERGVRFMVLGHRQEDVPGWVPGTWDDKPGLSSVQVHSEKDGWRYWRGSASGKKGAKFAEIRSTAEIENLYDWSTYGHADVETDAVSTDPLLPDVMKIESVGKDEVILSELTLKVEPAKETSKQEKIFSEGTAFYPDAKDKKYKLGGGQAFQGRFPGAHVLRPWGGELVIPLEEGKAITSVDIACGDSHDDGQTNSDGGYGKQGWAKLSVGIKKPNGEISWILTRENVPPEGVIMGNPKECNEKVTKGSSLIIKSDSDTTYIMGVHVGYK